jgi:hypothetical protein
MSQHPFFDNSDLRQMADNKRKTPRRDIPEGDVTAELARLSLKERARLSAMIEVDGDSALRTHLLGVVGTAETGRGALGPKRSVVPERWSQIHVLDRLEEAYGTLAAMPMVTRPKQFGNGMPTAVQDRLTHKDWIDLFESGELEKMQEEKNRVRRALTAAEITRMDQALRWPFDYLAAYPEVSRSVCLKARWSMAGADIGRRCKALGMNPHFFNRQWQHGLTVIATRLIQKRVPVS